MYIAEFRSTKRCLAAVALDASWAVSHLLEMAYDESPQEKWQAFSIRGLAGAYLPARPTSPITCRYLVKCGEGKEIIGRTDIAANQHGGSIESTELASWLAFCAHQAPSGVFILDEISVQNEEWLASQEPEPIEEEEEDAQT